LYSESEAEAVKTFSWKDFAEKLEFFFGSIIVFASFPLLWHVELRRFRCYQI
jgi:hypothetical protein